jgi:NADPH-dependent 2,4-dienoyl-CoA reductase/sulfur reductase-like enzyme
MSQAPGKPILDFRCHESSKPHGFQATRPKTRAVVIGSGFIGLDTAENLVHRGFEVTLFDVAGSAARMARRSSACSVPRPPGSAPVKRP